MITITKTNGVNWSWESETHVSVGIRYDITRDRRDNNFIV